MRRVDALITAARTLSRNSLNADNSYAISDDEILQYLNDAQDRLQNKISAAKNVAKIFATQQIVSLVANQEGYSIPDRVLMNKQIEMVEYSYDGNVVNYVPIEKVHLFNRNTNTSNYPYGYYKRGGQILLVNVPANSIGTLRVTYERDLDDLDIPRGVISSIGTDLATSFASITLANPANSYESTTPGWSNIQYCSIVDVNGLRKAFNVPVGSYDIATNILIPLGGTFTYTSQDVQIAVGDIAVFNKYSTTFSQLPDSCERYLIHSAAQELFHKDSSNDESKEDDILTKIENDILSALASQTSEVQFIPQQNRYDWW